jgi:tetratricopeptide (TPR) repeat protein
MNYSKALEYNLKALEIDEKSQEIGDIAADKINIGAIYNEKKDYAKALDMLFYGKNIKKSIGDKNGLANAYYMIGMVYFNLASQNKGTIENKYLQYCIAYLDSAVNVDKEIGYLDNMQKSYKCLSDAQQLSNDFKSAFTSYTLYNKIKDSIFSADKQSEIFNLEKKEEIEEKKREDEKTLEERERIEYLQMGGVCIFIVTLVLSLLVVRKKKINPQAVDILCTFSVLVFFEFVNVLIHGKIENLTNHNLILTLLCLLVIAAIILPIHHKIEHWVKKKVVAETEADGHHTHHH